MTINSHNSNNTKDEFDCAGPAVATEAAAPLTLTVNGQSATTFALTLEQLLKERDLAGAKVATALNGDFVRAAERAQTTLRAGDIIEIVAPRQGG